jgi:hypothetical protein
MYAVFFAKLFALPRMRIQASLEHGFCGRCVVRRAAPGTVPLWTALCSSEIGNMRNIVKAKSFTESERLLAKLAEKAFLSLWVFPNVYKDEGITKGQGEELCDLLVVFGDHVIIFSDKGEVTYKADHARRLCSTIASSTAFASVPTRTVAPPMTISIGHTWTAALGAGVSMRSGCTTTGTKFDGVSAAVAPWLARSSRRHLNTMFALTPCVCASFDTDTPGSHAASARLCLNSAG